jgi:hypothetical protein
MKQLLILTPDGVGSTFLQRAICIFGNLSNTEWINTHEMTNGTSWDGIRLRKNWSLGYSQSLAEIESLFSKNNHNIIARLASYHFYNRNDPIEEQKKFFDYLNKNFTIVACYRSNIFEYAHSWTIREYKKVLNVYSFAEKKSVHPVDDQFNLDSNYFSRKLTDYNNYVYWVNDNFKVSYEFNYDHLSTVDNFIASLIDVDNNIFINNFGISLYEYCHLSNMSDITKLPAGVCKAFAEVRKYAYTLINAGMMPNSLPLKMNSFENKIKKTSNFDQLVSVYNDQAKKHNHLQPLSFQEIKEIAESEQFGCATQTKIINNILNRFV